MNNIPVNFRDQLKELFGQPRKVEPAPAAAPVGDPAPHVCQELAPHFTHAGEPPKTDGIEADTSPLYNKKGRMESISLPAPLIDKA